MADVYVYARCVACGAKRAVRQGEVPPGELPTCEACFSPMFAESAVRHSEPAPDDQPETNA